MTDREDVSAAPGEATAGWVVAGEALVDLATERDGRLRPAPGGSPFNVAIGLGRLGVPTAYLGCLSTDGFGERLTSALTDAGVRLDLVTEVSAPTTLAVVHLDAEGHASYGFYLEGTAAAALTAPTLPPLPAGAGLHLSFGAIGAHHEPTGTALRSLLERERPHRLVSLDPNLRPSAFGDDVRAYRATLDAIVVECDLVKASDEDLAVLGVVDEVATTWAAHGPAVVVVTRGAAGATAFVGADRFEVPGRRVDLADTVGAGDAFTAGLLWSLQRAGVRTRTDLDALVADPARLRTAMAHAIAVAARTCERPGADPPNVRDLDLRNLDLRDLDLREPDDREPGPDV